MREPDIFIRDGVGCILCVFFYSLCLGMSWKWWHLFRSSSDSLLFCVWFGVGLERNTSTKLANQRDRKMARKYHLKLKIISSVSSFETYKKIGENFKIFCRSYKRHKNYTAFSDSSGIAVVSRVVSECCVTFCTKFSLYAHLYQRLSVSMQVQTKKMYFMLHIS